MSTERRKLAVATETDSAPSVVKSPPMSVKIVIAGGFGVGKTTVVGTLSDIPPLTTEAAMTTASLGIDDTSQVAGKTTTTVAMDFGRIAIDEEMVLFLFGTPGQDRFGFMWDDLIVGALGAVVLVDLRRIDDCFPAIDYFESRGIPFVVAINRFAGSDSPDIGEVREALDLDAEHPIVLCDARYRESVKGAVLTLIELLMTRSRRRQSDSRRLLG
jgi:signal recognition particle receptor subunit beta